MTSGTAAGGVFVCRKMLRNTKTYQQVRKAAGSFLTAVNFSLLRPGPPPGVGGGAMENRTGGHTFF